MRALAIRLLAVGVAFIVGALAVSANKLLAGVTNTLLPLGLLPLAAGGVLWWLTRARADAGDAEEPSVREAPWAAQSARAPVVDRTVTELERHSQSIAPGSGHRRAPTRWTAEVFEVIEWRRFEAVVERLSQQAGFETRSQSHGADGGVDIWLYSRTQPGQAVSVVQCKHWSGKRVGVDKVRELRGVMAAHAVSRGQFATTSTFTPDAIDFAKANGVNLLDVNRLLEQTAQRTETQQADLLAVALEGDYWRPTCANCGVRMVERPSKRETRAFWGCPNFRSRGCKPLPMKWAPINNRWQARRL